MSCADTPGGRDRHFAGFLRSIGSPAAGSDGPRRVRLERLLRVPGQNWCATGANVRPADTLVGVVVRQCCFSNLVPNQLLFSCGREAPTPAARSGGLVHALGVGGDRGPQPVGWHFLGAGVPSHTAWFRVYRDSTRLSATH